MIKAVCHRKGMKILLYSRAGSGKTAFIKSLIDRIRPGTIHLLAYADSHKAEIYDFVGRYKDKADVIATQNKDQLFDLFFKVSKFSDPNDECLSNGSWAAKKAKSD